MTPHNQKVKQAKQEAEMMQAQAQFNALVAQYKSLVGKTILVGIQGMGISTTNVTDVVGEMSMAIAIALSTDKNAGSEGQYWDVRQLTFYKVFSDEDALKLEAKFKSEQPATINVMPSAPRN